MHIDPGGRRFFCYVFASLRSSRYLPFPRFEPSWASAKARNLYSAPAYTSKARERHPGDEVAAYAKKRTWVCE